MILSPNLNAYIVELGVIVELCARILFFSHIKVCRVPVGKGVDHRREEDDSSIACVGGCLQGVTSCHVTSRDIISRHVTATSRKLSPVGAQTYPDLTYRLSIATSK